jgi:hypothetical protein
MPIDIEVPTFTYFPGCDGDLIKCEGAMRSAELRPADVIVYIACSCSLLATSDGGIVLT